MIGKRIGHYEVTAKLGEGGMGEVWRATDSKLGREVAIKMLPATFSEDEERLGRFEREAKVLASLNHPHIAAIYGIEDAEGARALVLELVEGPTLDARMSNGALPLEECLAIARQIAEALEEAHSKGIVHRDLKPQNVKLTADDRVKVLDFGLAKALDPLSGKDSSPSQLAHSPTLTLGATIQGVILGTAAYMSPEQAKGAAVDHRADVWAFGVVLWEMLTGRRLFAGDTVPETLAGVLKSDIEFDGLPPELPSKLVRLVRRCLERQPKNRLHSIADARIVLEEIQRGDLDESEAVEAAPVTPPRPLWQTLAALGGALAVGAALALAIAKAMAPTPEPPEVVRFEVPQPESLPVVGSPKLSPDGRYLAMDASDEEGVTRIWVRPLSAIDFQPLPGTEGTGRPFWSPDSRSLGFMADGKLKRIAVTGGPPQTICDAPTGADGTWGEDGTILFDGTGTDPIQRVPASGGVPTPFIEPKESGQVGWPQFLPGGDRLLFLDISEGGGGLRIANADGSDPLAVLDEISRVEYAPPGYLLFVREETLVAQRFDADSGKLLGEPTPVADGLGVDAVGLADFSASRSGALAFRAGSAGGSEYVWVDRRGSRVEPVLEGTGYSSFALSPDGRWLAYTANAGAPNDLWIRDLRRGVSSRFTFDEGGEQNPVFTPDGRRILFVSWAEGRPQRIVSRALDRSGEDEILFEAPDTSYRLILNDVSPDGRDLIAVVRKQGETGDLWRIPSGRPGAATPLFTTPQFWEWNGEISPDGKWLAFASDESGVPEIYVVAFGGGSGRWQISTRGGDEPHWASDGRELLYTATDGRMMSVEVETGRSFEAGVPQPLFQATLRQGEIRNLFVVSADGERFLTLAPAGSRGGTPTTVILNWAAGLARR